MQIAFTKMHGLGNDFVVIDCINQVIDLSKEQIQFIANRHFGIGCDQLLLVESSDVPDADFRYRIFNANGGEVEQCGNGARCFAIFVRDEGLSTKKSIPVMTSTGLITLNIEENDQVTVDMGIPILTPEKIPFATKDQSTSYNIVVAGQPITLAAISIGNPHAVLLVDDINTAPVEELGRLLQADSHFPNSVNVGFMQIIDRDNIKLRVYERGVGETQACGTVACAAVVEGHTQVLLNDHVAVKLLGGNLAIRWAGETNPVMMTGSTATVFKGMITL
jgi:diaminopimelate epimerase